MHTVPHDHAVVLANKQDTIGTTNKKMPRFEVSLRGQKVHLQKLCASTPSLIFVQETEFSLQGNKHSGLRYRAQRPQPSPLPLPCPHLLQSGLQLLLPLLCLLQHRLPARVQPLQAVPKAAGVVPCARFQELVACSVHCLHSCLVGQDIILQHLTDMLVKCWTPLQNVCLIPACFHGLEPTQTLHKGENPSTEADQTNGTQWEHSRGALQVQPR